MRRVNVRKIGSTFLTKQQTLNSRHPEPLGLAFGVGR